MAGRPLRRLAFGLSVGGMIACYEVHSTVTPPAQPSSCIRTADCWCQSDPVTTVSFAPAMVDFGTHPPGSSTEATLTVTNTGTIATGDLWGDFHDASVFAPLFTFKGMAGFPGDGGTCTGKLSPGASCTVILTFSPPVNVNHGAQFATFRLYPAGQNGCFVTGGGAGSGGGGSVPPTVSVNLTATD